MNDIYSHSIAFQYLIRNRVKFMKMLIYSGAIFDNNFDLQCKGNFEYYCRLQGKVNPFICISQKITEPTARRAKPRIFVKTGECIRAVTLQFFRNLESYKSYVRCSAICPIVPRKQESEESRTRKSTRRCAWRCETLRWLPYTCFLTWIS